MMLQQWVTGSDYLLMQHHIPETRILNYIAVKSQNSKVGLPLPGHYFTHQGWGSVYPPAKDSKLPET